ncbi:MAG: hypothetical protein GY765_13915 [bacterium]|nr:hypothetical protein [bacterium]
MSRFIIRGRGRVLMDHPRQHEPAKGPENEYPKGKHHKLETFQDKPNGKRHKLESFQDKPNGKRHKLESFQDKPNGKRYKLESFQDKPNGNRYKLESVRNEANGGRCKLADLHKCPDKALLTEAGSPGSDERTTQETGSGRRVTRLYAGTRSR